MKASNIYYTIDEMATLIGVSRTAIFKRIKKLRLSFCIKTVLKNKNIYFLYSLEKFNLIASIGTRIKNYHFVVSDFTKVNQTFAEFQSKINNNGFN